MKTFLEWRARKEKAQKDAAGGIVPQQMTLAKQADLITLPAGVTGTNCFNCRWVKKEGDIGDCGHPKIMQYVNARNCCAYWDHDGVKRSWKK